jgi:hypothetical protein
VAWDRSFTIAFTPQPGESATYHAVCDCGECAGGFVTTSLERTKTPERRIPEGL